MGFDTVVAVIAFLKACGRHCITAAPNHPRALAAWS
jgi:hypothetical protein